MDSRTLIDIKGGRDLKGKRRIGKRLNLNSQKVIYIPLKSLIKTVFVLLAVFSFIFGSVAAPTSNGVMAAQTGSDEQRKILEDQLTQMENQISDYEAKIEQYKTQGTSLQAEIKKMEAQISKLNLQIKAVNLTLKNLDIQIGETQDQIKQTQSDIELNKTNLSQTLQTLYENDSKSVVEILISNPRLSDFVGDINNLLSVQDNIRVTIQGIIDDQQKLLDQKQVLSLQKNDALALKEYQDNQKASIQQTQTQKSDLLKETKGQESNYQKILTETKKTAAQLRQQLFNLIGGGEMTLGDAYKLAKAAQDATGVRAALLLAVLDRESALGKNVGKCSYETAMNPVRDMPIFLALIKNLGLEKDLDAGIIKVSCANADGAYGGAMGPAQFIPSTWQLYSDRISQLTGSNPASPWKNYDAFMATALYLKDAGAGPGATLAEEKKAAAKYYAGSRWRTYLSTYGARVISAAQQFEDDIAILNS